MSLKDKTAIITGGGTGIGEATALLFAREGARVLITGRREEKLKEVREIIQNDGYEIWYSQADISKENECKSLVDLAIKLFGRVDILFNNAGVIFPGVTHETSTEMWDKTFDVNVKGAYMMSKYVIPVMIDQGEGVIVNNASTVGLKGFPGISAYVASKGAVVQLTRSMALEYAKSGIRVNCICPGAVVTPMITEGFLERQENRKEAEELMISFHPIGRMGKPEEIAHAVKFLCDDNIGFMTGNMLSVDGGWIAK